MSASTPEAAFALLQAGRHEEAERAWRSILELHPRDVQARHMLGLALARCGRIDEGLAFLAGSIEAEPRNPGFLNNRGLILGELGRLSEAERDLRKAIALDPDVPAFLVHLGSLLRRQGRLDEALPAFRKALALEPGNPEAQAGIGYLQRGRAGDLVNRGNARKDAGDLEGAAELYDQAIALEPELPEAHNNRGNVALEAGDLGLARRLYRRAAELRADYVDPRFSLAQLDLFERDFAAGWDGYERRFYTTPPMAIRRAPPLPEMTLAGARAGARVAVWSEQGVGDQILFSTLLPELVAAGARPVVEIDSRLLGLYSRSLPAVRFVATGTAAGEFAKCEAQVALGSLPRLFRRDAAAFARQPERLLVADPARVAAVRERLGPGRWIGVSWKSLQGPGRQYLERRKSMPGECLLRLAAIPGARLLDLQYGDADADRRALAGRLERLAGLDAFGDLEGLAAALAACESLVTVSNATAHLAGALGIPTLLLYPGGKAPFHYWVPGPGARSAWYPSVEVVTVSGAPDWRPVAEVAARRIESRGPG